MELSGADAVHAMLIRSNPTARWYAIVVIRVSREVYVGIITDLATKLKMHPSDVREVLEGYKSFAAAKESEVSNVAKEFGVGSPVIYIDSLGRERPALVTNLFGPLESNPSINVVVVNLDDDQTDTYGRKIERFTSVVHHSYQYAHGNKWKPISE